MPIYEFSCSACRTKRDVLVRAAPGGTPRCPVCGGEMARLISRFAIHRTLKDVHQSSGEPGPGRGLDYYKDPRNIGRWAERKLEEAGMEVPAGLRAEIDAARDGALPDGLEGL
ncbi:MAG: zinc ribbon domain-containing protein [Chloroflexi bacterium]|nr:zinc ribbon domain-containing protein [Chloroflexota bacterium]